MLNRRRDLWVLVALLASSGAQTIGQSPRRHPATTKQHITASVNTPPPDPADYPSYDFETFRLLTEGLARKATTARLARNPNDPEIIADLLKQERDDEALVVLRSIVSAYPERMTTAFEAMHGQGGRFGSRAHGHPEALQEVVNAAKQQLSRLPREDAARVARQLLLVDSQSTCPGPNRIEIRLRCFLDDYAGTETALLSQVDLVEFHSRPVAERLACGD